MARGIRVGLALALAAVLALTVVGCASSEPTTQPAGESAAPTTNGQTETPATEGEATADGAALTEQKCTMCHPIDRVNSVKYDAAGWEEVIARMEQNGLVVTPEERQAILDYLVQRDAAN